MISGWIYIFLSLFCSTLIAHLLRLAKEKNYSIVPILVINYGVATIISLFNSDSISNLFEINNGLTIFFSVLVGVGFIINFFIYSQSLKKNGIGLSVTIMRISLIFPVLAGVLIWGESISLLNSMGIILIIGTIILLSRDKKSNMFVLASPILLILLFLISGFNDISLKIYELYIQQHFDSYLFMAIVFFAAGIAGLIVMQVKNISFKPNYLILGCLIGVPNLYSSIYTIEALKTISSPIVFSAVNAGTIVMSSLIGKYYWSDKLSQKQLLAIIISTIALIMLIQ